MDERLKRIKELFWEKVLQDKETLHSITEKQGRGKRTGTLLSVKKKN